MGPEFLTLKRLEFLAGPRSGSAPTEIDCSPVVVLVGPNGSGKTRALREIQHLACSRPEPTTRVVRTANFSIPHSADAARAFVERFVIPEAKGSPPLAHAVLTLPGWRGEQGEDWVSRRVDTDRLSAAFASDFEPAMFDEVERFATNLFSVDLRLSLLRPSPVQNLYAPPNGLLMYLFQNDALRHRVRAQVAAAIGRYPVVGVTGLTEFELRMSDVAPESDVVEKGLAQESVDFHGAATGLDELGHGLRAFVGLATAILSSPVGTVLVDEPELFMHPPLARQLGQDLSRWLGERGSSLVAATHRADFLMGCIEVAPTTVVRLTYESGVGTACALDAADLATVTRHPLMRSARVVEALFHRGAVVCEADTDRAFYAEVNARLRAANRGIRDAVFLNAQNAQTIAEIVEPLRRLGVPAAAVVDLDALAGGDYDALAPLLRATGIAEYERHRLLRRRTEITGAIRSTFPSTEAKVGAVLKREGIAGLDASVGEGAWELLEELAELGIFFVPVGELERWLPELGSGGKGPRWLIRVFERFGSDEAASDYVRPGAGDVWAFVDKVARWVDAPDRRGMPQ